MIVFVGFLLFLGFGFDVFYIGEGALTFPIGSLAALGIGSVSALTSYYSGDRAVLLSTGAMALDRALSSAGADESIEVTCAAPPASAATVKPPV